MSESMVSSIIMQILLYSAVAFGSFNFFYDRTFKKQLKFLKHFDPRTPREHVDWLSVKETLTPFGLVFMSRRKLMREVAEAVVESGYMTPDKPRDVRKVERYLRTLSSTSIFFAKQSILVARHLDWCHGSGMESIITGMIKLHDFDDATLIGKNIRKFPRTETTIASFRSIASQLGVTDGIVPNLAVQMKASYYAREIGYEAGYNGALVHIVKDHLGDYVDIVEYCAERGAENFSEEEYRRYLEVGVLRDGVL